MIASCIFGYLLLAALARKQIKPDANMIPLVTIH